MRSSARRACCWATPVPPFAYLDQALAASHTLHSPVTEVVSSWSWAGPYRAAHRLDLALTYLQQGLTVAGAIDARNELFNTHLLLSEVYEELGDAAQALAHFKRYQSFTELVAGEKANQRLQVLQVAHDTGGLAQQRGRAAAWPQLNAWSRKWRNRAKPKSSSWSPRSSSRVAATHRRAGRLF